MAPAVVGGGFYQISLLLDIFLANYIQNQNPGLGAVVSLDYSQRLIQLPTGIIGVALATTTLPTLLDSLKKNKADTIPENLLNTLSFALYITLPAAIGFILLGEEIIDSIFFGGKWDKNSTATTLQALQFYSIAIPAFSMNKILISSYYAFQDTKTPLKINMISFTANICMNLFLMKYFLHAGLALASSISAFITFSLLVYYFKKHNVQIQIAALIKNILRQLIPLLGLILWIYIMRFYEISIREKLFFLEYQWIQRFFLSATILPAMIIFFAISYFMKLNEFKIIFGKILRRRN